MALDVQNFNDMPHLFAFCDFREVNLVRESATGQIVLVNSVGDLSKIDNSVNVSEVVGFSTPTPSYVSASVAAHMPFTDYIGGVFYTCASSTFSGSIICESNLFRVVDEAVMDFGSLPEVYRHFSLDASFVSGVSMPVAFSSRQLNKTRMDLVYLDGMIGRVLRVGFIESNFEILFFEYQDAANQWWVPFHFGAGYGGNSRHSCNPICKGSSSNVYIALHTWIDNYFN